MKNTLAFIAILFLLSCSEEKEELLPGQKEANGTVWVSGGLFYCAEQIRTNKGDTLIPMMNGRNQFHYQMGQKVYVVYEELNDVEPGCNNAIACKIIKVETKD